MEMAKEQELILVLDFGSQYNQLHAEFVKWAFIVNYTIMKFQLKKLRK